MKNDYMERISETETAWASASKMEQRVSANFGRAKERGFDIFVFSEPLHCLTQNLPEFTAIMHTADLTEFYYSAEWSNWMQDALELDEAGWKMQGITRLENPERKKDLERWGSSDRPETIPALRFIFAE